MNFTKREKLLIINALHILESQCIGDELHYEKVSEFGGTPDYTEIRTLMDRFDDTTLWEDI